VSGNAKCALRCPATSLNTGSAISALLMPGLGINRTQGVIYWFQELAAPLAPLSVALFSAHIAYSSVAFFFTLSPEVHSLDLCGWIAKRCVVNDLRK